MPIFLLILSVLLTIGTWNYYGNLDYQTAKKKNPQRFQEAFDKVSTTFREEDFEKLYNSFSRVLFIFIAVLTGVSYYYTYLAFTV